MELTLKNVESKGTCTNGFWRFLAEGKCILTVLRLLKQEVKQVKEDHKNLRELLDRTKDLLGVREECGFGFPLKNLDEFRRFDGQLERSEEFCRNFVSVGMRRWWG